MFPGLVGVGHLWREIDKQSIAATATATVNWTKEYETVFILCDDIQPATTDNEMQVQTIPTIGGAADSGATDYGYQNSTQTSGFVPDVTATAAAIQCLGESSVNNGLADNGHLFIWIPRPYDTGKHAVLSGSGGGIAGSALPFSAVFTGKRNADGAIYGVEFSLTSGNFTTMNITAFGLLRSR